MSSTQEKSQINLTTSGALDYAMEQYKLYVGHINTSFNYTLVLEGLIANAYVTSLSKDNGDAALATGFALLGALVTVVLWLVYVRSRSFVTTIEGLLKIEEKSLFSGGPGFLNVDNSNEWRIKKHTYQFNLLYGIFFVSFLAAAVYPHAEIIRALAACYRAGNAI